MSIAFQCACGKQYRVKDEMAGKRVRCAACGAALQVPARDGGEADGAYDLAGAAAGAGDAGSAAPRAEARLADPPVGAHGTVASNAGRLYVNWFRYYNAFPEGPIVWLLTLGLAVVAAVRFGPLGGAVFAAAAVILALRDVMTVRAKFAGGDVNPGVVIAAKPYLVAVHVDMSSTGTGPARSAIKILRQPLARMAGGPPAVGARLATVSVYHGSPGEGAWRDVSPTVVNCATDDAGAIARVAASIPEREWKALDRALAQAPDRKPGLYTLWDGNRSGRPGQTHPAAAAVVIIVVVGGLVLPVLFGERKQPRSDRSTPTAVAKSDVPAEAVAPPPEPPAAEPTAEVGAPDETAFVPAPAPAGTASAPASAPVSAPSAAPTSELTAAPVPASESAAAPVPVPSRESEPTTVPAPAQSTPRVPRPQARPASRPTAGSAARGETLPEARVAPAPEKAKPAEPDGEKVEVLWGSRWYPATVLRREGQKAYVKYEGWSENFNELVTPDRVRKPQPGAKSQVERRRRPQPRR